MEKVGFKPRVKKRKKLWTVEVMMMMMMMMMKMMNWNDWNALNLKETD